MTSKSDQNLGVLRLNMTAQARYKAAVMASADNDDAIRAFVLDQIDQRRLFIASPRHATSGDTQYLILGRRCILITSLDKARSGVMNKTWPAALRVETIREVHESVLEQLRPLAYEPDSSEFEIKILLRDEEKSFTEFAYELVRRVDWNNFGHQIDDRLSAIIESGPKMPTDSWRLVE